MTYDFVLKSMNKLSSENEFISYLVKFDASLIESNGERETFPVTAKYFNGMVKLDVEKLEKEIPDKRVRTTFMNAAKIFVREAMI